GVLAFFHDDAALDAGADVVAAAVAEGLQQVVRFGELDDPRVLRLRGRDALEAALRQHLAKLPRCLRLDSQACVAFSAGKFDEPVKGFGSCRHRSSGHVSLDDWPESAFQDESSRLAQVRVVNTPP